MAPNDPPESHTNALQRSDPGLTKLLYPCLTKLLYAGLTKLLYPGLKDRQRGNNERGARGVAERRKRVSRSLLRVM